MFYTYDITIPANTVVKTPYKKTLSITVGVITHISIKFARGCHGMVKVRLERFKYQLTPSSAGEWVTGDNEAVESNEYFDVREVPAELVFLGCSPGTSYEHTVSVRVTVLPKPVASMIPLIEILTKVFTRLGVFR